MSENLAKAERILEADLKAYNEEQMAISKHHQLVGGNFHAHLLYEPCTDDGGDRPSVFVEFVVPGTLRTAAIRGLIARWFREPIHLYRFAARGSNLILHITVDLGWMEAQD